MFAWGSRQDEAENFDSGSSCWFCCYPVRLTCLMVLWVSEPDSLIDIFMAGNRHFIVIAKGRVAGIMEFSARKGERKWQPQNPRRSTTSGTESRDAVSPTRKAEPPNTTRRKKCCQNLKREIEYKFPKICKIIHYDNPLWFRQIKINFCQVFFFECTTPLGIHLSMCTDPPPKTALTICPPACLFILVSLLRWHPFDLSGHLFATCFLF